MFLDTFTDNMRAGSVCLPCKNRVSPPFPLLLFLPLPTQGACFARLSGLLHVDQLVDAVDHALHQLHLRGTLAALHTHTRTHTHTHAHTHMQKGSDTQHQPR